MYIVDFVFRHRYSRDWEGNVGTNIEFSFLNKEDVSLDEGGVLEPVVNCVEVVHETVTVLASVSVSPLPVITEPV